MIAGVIAANVTLHKKTASMKCSHLKTACTLSPLRGQNERFHIHIPSDRISKDLKKAIEHAIALAAINEKRKS